MGLRFSKLDNSIATFKVINTSISDPDAQAFINITGISGTNATATTQLVLDLKAANIWIKMKALYPVVGGTATTHMYNLKNPLDTNAAFRLFFSGGWVHSSTGAKPNGTNGYANTFLTPSVSLSVNSTHISYYSRTNVNSSYHMGGQSSSPQTALVLNTGFNAQAYVNSNTTQLSVSGTTGNKFVIASRISNALSLTVQGVVSNFSGAPTGLYPYPIVLSAININGGTPTDYTTKEIIFASIGDGLTDAEAVSFHNAVQAFNTTLGRQV